MRLALIALVMFSVTGCISNSTLDYATAWDPPLLAQNDCPNIAGDYVSRPGGHEPMFIKVKQADGSTREVYNPRHSMNRSLFLFEAFGVLPGEHLSITQPDDQTILVHSWKFYRELGTPWIRPRPYKQTLSLSSGDFSCVDGKVEIYGRRSCSTGMMIYVGVIGCDVQTRVLAPSVDHLIVESRNAGGGVILVLPAFARSNRWYRHARVSQSNTKFKDELAVVYFGPTSELAYEKLTPVTTPVVDIQSVDGTKPRESKDARISAFVMEILPGEHTLELAIGVFRRTIWGRDRFPIKEPEIMTIKFNAESGREYRILAQDNESSPPKYLVWIEDVKTKAVVAGDRTHG